MSWNGSRCGFVVGPAPPHAPRVALGACDLNVGAARVGSVRRHCSRWSLSAWRFSYSWPRRLQGSRRSHGPHHLSTVIFMSETQPSEPGNTDANDEHDGTGAAPSSTAKSVLVVDFEAWTATEQNGSPLHAALQSQTNVPFLVFATSRDIVSAHDVVLASSTGLEEPACWICENGLAVYQRSYKTGDPYYSEQVWKGFDPKPVQWICESSFKDEDQMKLFSETEGGGVADAPYIDPDFVQPEARVLLRTVKRAHDPEDLRKRLNDALNSMGINCSVRIVRQEEGTGCVIFRVQPSKGSVPFAAEFIRNGIGASADRTVFVTADDACATQLLQQSSFRVIASEKTDADVDSDGRLFRAADLSSQSILTGLKHFGII
ncbi:hypothetical protein FVE85_9207 [Porphyridium purpureum]|uniref:Sucrose phosphatase-like domain-containing protein n=1 Tax=Porphyridium purpureum TaxID=35688 RepID=A0A5J4YP19_PORPP|nr:hypothetical protein FVE85_9207 [Porphyridium purpureum]|eukprot:POR1147..scf222_8